jgi:hypothetical protein
MTNVTEEKALTTADLAASAQMSPARQERTEDPEISARDTRPVPAAAEDDRLAPLFLAGPAQAFRDQWDAVQIGFVDDPKQAVRKADELVAQVMKSLAETFSSERSKLEAQVDSTEQASTENLRVALRRYRSFFQRLLSL